MIDLERNRNEFISILKSNVTRMSEEQLEFLINCLDSYGFFTAPASTVFHSCFEGGLCWHSLCVYKRLLSLAKDSYSNETIAIVSLLHDFDKTFSYQKTAKNEKIYSQNGSKHDELGNFDWVAKLSWTRRPAEERFVLGTHGQNCAYLTSKFVPLTDDEYSAILNHMGGHEVGIDENYTTSILKDVYPKNKLAALLHAADFLASQIDETFDPSDVTYDESKEYDKFVFTNDFANNFIVGQVVSVSKLEDDRYIVDGVAIFDKDTLLKVGHFGDNIDEIPFDCYTQETNE